MDTPLSWCLQTAELSHLPSESEIDNMSLEEKKELYRKQERVIAEYKEIGAVIGKYKQWKLSQLEKQLKNIHEDDGTVTRNKPLVTSRNYVVSARISTQTPKIVDTDVTPASERSIVESSVPLSTTGAKVMEGMQNIQKRMASMEYTLSNQLNEMKTKRTPRRTYQ